jgi:uncharacterized protein with GYD domain
MPEYVLLIKLTDHGAESSVDGLPKLIAKMEKTMTHLQGTMRVVLTLGDYDMVAMGRTAGDEELAWFAGHIAAEGQVRVKTLKGFTPEEWAAIQSESEPQGPTAKPFGH